MNGYPEIVKFKLNMSMPAAGFPLRLETISKNNVKVGQASPSRLKQAGALASPLSLAQKFIDDIGG